MNCFGVVYLATDTVDGKQYVGQTTKPLAVRVKGHVRAAKKPVFPMHLAIQLHGPDAFTFKEIFVAYDRAALNWAEELLIEKIAPELNATRGGAGSKGRRPADEAARLRRSETSKRFWRDPATRERIVTALREAGKSDRAKAQGRKLALSKLGPNKRWAGHTKRVPVRVDRGESTRLSWQRPDVRERRMVGLLAAAAKPERRAAIRARLLGRVMRRSSVEKAARAKWIPLFCPELQCSFLSGRHAASFLSACPSSVSQAVSAGYRVQRKYTLIPIGGTL